MRHSFWVPCIALMSLTVSPLIAGEVGDKQTPQVDMRVRDTYIGDAHLRIARPTDHLETVVAFYRDGLGFEVLGSFEDHEGFDGVMLGHRETGYHLELTHQRGHPVGRAPNAEHLLVFYLPNKEAWRSAVDRLHSRGHEAVPSNNPYWDYRGKTFEDPDGYRVVLQNAAWGTTNPGSASCSAVRVRPQAGDDTPTYIAAMSFSELQCQLAHRIDADSLHPAHQIWARSTYSFAHDLATWVSQVLKRPSIRLKFAYYANVRPDETTTPCRTTPNGPYASGGGDPLCQLIEDVTRLNGLSPFLTSLLDFGHRSDVNGDPNWAKYTSAAALEARVGDLGFLPFVNFAHAFDTSFVYNPRVDRFGEMLSFPLESLPSGWYGASGGGGSGAGFEIFCQDPDGSNQVTLVTGGGGGGGGMSSPESGTTLQAGGGGGGGVQIGAKGLPRIGAGMGNHPYGLLDVHSDVDPGAFALAMEKVIADMKTCHETPGRVVALRGGGGGGGGWETYLEWDPTDPLAQPVERTPHGMNVGYGFQFALGDGVKLTSNADADELPFAVCPFDPDEQLGQKCFSDQAKPSAAAAADTPAISPGQLETPDHSSPSTATTRRTTIDYAATHAVFSCAATVATRICGLATYLDPATQKATSYGSYSSYVSCNCPVSNMYQDTHLPDASPWNLIPRTCSYGSNADSGTRALPPTVTKAMIEAHPEWCVTVEGCSPHPACRE